MVWGGVCRDRPFSSPWCKHAHAHTRMYIAQHMDACNQGWGRDQQTRKTHTQAVPSRLQVTQWATSSCTGTRIHTFMSTQTCICACLPETCMYACMVCLDLCTWSYIISFSLSYVHVFVLMLTSFQGGDYWMPSQLSSVLLVLARD